MIRDLTPRQREVLPYLARRCSGAVIAAQMGISEGRANNILGEIRAVWRICAVCTGCPLDDPEPCGVIRRGVAYGDTGRPLPICGDCGYPVAGYRGGTVHCPRCALPNVFVPGVAWLNRRRVLALAGLPAREVARRVGVSANSVWRIRGEAAAKAAA